MIHKIFLFMGVIAVSTVAGIMLGELLYTIFY